MDLTKPIDIYCERLDSSIWAEPINAVTNFAFVLAAIIMWFRCKNLVEGKVLAVLLFSIGCGSLLFHILANLGCHIGCHINSYFHISVYLCSKSQVLGLVKIG